MTESDITPPEPDFGETPPDSTFDSYDDQTVDESSEAEILADQEIAGDGWSGSDIEEAYQRALEAMEEIEPPADDSSTAEMPSEELLDQEEPVASLDDDGEATASTTGDVIESGDAASAETAGSSSAEEVDAVSKVDSGDKEPAAAPVEPVTKSVCLSRGTEPTPKPAPVEDYSNVSPPQVLEAALFVGGNPLTARKIVGLLRGSYDVEFVEQAIDELNAAYAAQGRPYEIRLGEGGYRLELRAEYDRLRHRVYGSAPREVRLTQEVLEVLALVAYRQPIAQEEIEGYGKQNAGNLLRQLIRRDLVAFERGPGGRKDLRYHTTDRFLSVFGLARIDDLPQAEDLAKK